MEYILLWIVIGSSIWVVADANSIGVTSDVNSGHETYHAASNPA